jgi:hypothetical protein
MEVTGTVALALAVAAVVVLAVKIVIAVRYDPNNAAEAPKRLELAKQRMLPVNLYDVMKQKPPDPK